ncbi:hypothetical protein MMC08_002161 [Hypocenomyce scalaris]|nr:hypothetical protein [Hypocenomyce scalaris]
MSQSSTRRGRISEKTAAWRWDRWGSMTRRRLTPQPTQKLLLPTRLNATVNRLTKTRLESPASALPPAKEAHLAALRQKAHRENQARRKEDAALAQARRREKEQKEHGYEEGWGEDAVRELGRANDEGGWDEDDFM